MTKVDISRNRIEALIQCIEHLEDKLNLGKALTDGAFRRAREAKARLDQAERKLDEAESEISAGYDRGFRAGIEAAAKIMDREARFWSGLCNDWERVDREGLAKEIRSLAPTTPTDTVRQAAEVLLGDPPAAAKFVVDYMERETNLPFGDMIGLRDMERIRALAAREGE